MNDTKNSLQIHSEKMKSSPHTPQKNTPWLFSSPSPQLFEQKDQAPGRMKSQAPECHPASSSKLCHEKQKKTSWNAKCPIFEGNFTPKTSNYCIKNRALGFPGYYFPILLAV